MFDLSGVGGLDEAGLAAVVVGCRRALVEQECGLLVLAAEWADRFPPERDGVGCGGVGVLGGGAGTPEVAEFAAAELGLLVETTTGGARHLIADALDLRHRLPLLWARVRAGQVRAGKARKVAEATRHLSVDAAAVVDAAVAGAVTALPWARFLTLLEASIVRADPAGAQTRARWADAERFVRAGRASEHGLKLLVARAAAGDVVWFVAMVNRIADILQTAGDPDPVDVRRSKAIGILAQPAEALRLLLDHQDDPPHPADPAETPDSAEAVEAAVEVEQSAPYRSVRLSPLPVDPDRCRPGVTVYVHLSAEALAAGRGVARVEDLGPILLDRVGRLVGERCRVTVRPVVDLADTVPVDAYEIPARMRQALHHRQPASVFPYGGNTSRRRDADHTIPYCPTDNGGPPGQTRIGNLGLLTRSEHRFKTFGRTKVRQPEPGTFLWRSPHGYLHLVNHAGTHPLGNGPLATALWNTASAMRCPRVAGQ